MKTLNQHHCHGGTVHYVEHEANTTHCTMRFTIFLPHQAAQQKCPALFYLAGLTCTEDNFTTKANAYKTAAELGLIIIAPDTSPRGDNVPDDEAYDMGKGAGFYLNATQAPWSTHFHMESYITEELRELVVREFPVDGEKLGIFGHSMGGHGALTLYLKYPHLFKSVSAFAPICAPSQCPWGKKAFTNYLGDDASLWSAHDATALMETSATTWKEIARAHILIDQGLGDNFLAEQLHPHLFEAACKAASHPLTLRKHEAYDHGYFFIQSFIDDHLYHHQQSLK